MSVDPELSAKRRAAALSGWQNLTPEQRRARTAAAREKRYANLMDEVDPRRELPPEKRLEAAKELQRVRLAEATLRSSVQALRRAEQRIRDDLGPEALPEPPARRRRRVVRREAAWRR